MNTPTIVMLIILAALIAALIIIYRQGRRKMREYDEMKERIDAAAQPATILVIDKKRMRIRDAGFSKFVMENIPERTLRSKAFIIKAKVGPKISPFMCEKEIFEKTPLNQSIKAMISGLYIVDVKAIRGPALVAPPKTSRWERIKDRIIGK
ncbi:MAG: hypothetical protein K5637_04880 [Lachnospiraceae bacterium]|nr:hypothetical protein [Lachnospiraceae bacterium]